MSENKISWGHQGSIGKFHVDMGEDHHHSPSLYPPPRDENGNIKVRSWDQMPAPWGPIRE